MNEMQRGVFRMQRKNSFFSLLMITLMLLSSITLMEQGLGVHAQDQTEEEPFVILFDQAHGQFFNASLYESALAQIQFIFQQHSDKLPPLEIHVNEKEPFSRELLAGVDLLIITNPGVAPSGNFTEKEKLALVEWYQQGKGMILLSNPYVQESRHSNAINITGRPEYLNSLLDNNYITISGALFTTAVVDDEKLPDTLVDERHSIDSAHEILEIDLTTKPKEETVIEEMIYNVSKVYTWTQSISIQNKTITVWPTTVKRLSNGKIEVPSGIPSIFGATTVQETGFRVVLGGSSVMFSDLVENTTESKWIDLGNNLQLWINVILWAGHFDPEVVLSPPPEILSLSDLTILGVFVIMGVVFILMGVVYRFIGPYPLEVIGVDEAARRLQKRLGDARGNRVRGTSAGETIDSKPASAGKRARRRRQLQKPKSLEKKK